MKSLSSSRRPLRCALTLLACLLLTACASKLVHLDDTQRAALSKQPVIHVVHYATPAPKINPPTAGHGFVKVKLHPVPKGDEVLSNLGRYDPTLEMASEFTKALAKSAGLGNLRMEPGALPLPVAADSGVFKDRFKNGAVLEVWIERWEFQFFPMDWKTYAITLRVGSRLTQPGEGKILWSAGQCDYGWGGNSYDNRIVLADLKTSESKKTQAKIKQTLSTIATVCASELLRDYARNQ